MTLADRIVVLRAGRIEQVGAPPDLYDDPDNLFVAGFLGSPRMNFLPATVRIVEQLGASTFVHAECAAGIPLAAELRQRWRAEG